MQVLRSIRYALAALMVVMVIPVTMAGEVEVVGAEARSNRMAPGGFR